MYAYAFLATSQPIYTALPNPSIQPRILTSVTPSTLPRMSGEAESVSDVVYRQLLRRYVSQRENIQTWSDYFFLQEGRRPQVRTAESASGESSSGQVAREMYQGVCCLVIQKNSLEFWYVSAGVGI